MIRLFFFVFLLLVPVTSYSASYPSGFDLQPLATLMNSAEVQAAQAGKYIVTDGMNVPVGYSFRYFDVMFPSAANSSLSAPMSRAAVTATEKAVFRKGLGYAAGAIPYIGFALSAYMMYDDIRDIVNSDPSRYPNLYQATILDRDLSVDDLNSSPGLISEGSTVSGVKQLEGGYVNGLVKVGPAVSSYYTSTSCAPYYNSGAFVALSSYSGTPANGTCADGSHVRSGIEVLYRPSSIVSSPALPLPADDGQMTYNLGGSSGLGSAQDSELVDAMLNNPSKVHLDNPSPVADSIASEQNKEIAAKQAEQVQNLKDRVADLQTKCDANPGSDYCTELKKAKAELADAEEKQIVGIQQQTDKPVDSPEPDEIKTLNFESFKGLGDLLSTKFPFNYLPLFYSTLSVLASEPRAPTFDLPLPLNNTIHVDLSLFDPVAVVCRWVTAFGFTLGILYLVYRRFAG